MDKWEKSSVYNTKRHTMYIDKEDTDFSRHHISITPIAKSTRWTVIIVNADGTAESEAFDTRPEAVEYAKKYMKEN